MARLILRGGMFRGLEGMGESAAARAGVAGALRELETEFNARKFALVFQNSRDS